MWKKELKTILKEVKLFWHEMKKYFLIIAVFLVISFLAIFRANFLYVDDLDRTIDGYRGWGGFSRYTSELSSILVHTNTRLGDISPWTQILAILFLALACCILLYVFKIKLYHQKIRVWDIAAVALLAISPYFLSCFSYKFDSPFMALSILASVLPVFFFTISRRSFYISIVISGLLMCTTYQAASGIFPMCCLMLFFTEILLGKNLKENAKLFSLGFFIYLVTLLAFSILLMRKIPDESYVSNTILPFGQLLSGTFAHLGAYYNLIINDFQPLWLILILIILMSFPSLAILKSKGRRLKVGMVAIISVILMLLMAFGVYPCFEKILTEPRAMFGFGVLIALVALQVSCLIEYSKSAHNRQFVYAFLVPIFALAYSFFTFANLYGNSLDMQQQWLEFRVAMLADDLKSSATMAEYDRVFLSLHGTIGYAAGIEEYAGDTGANILSRLIPISLRGDDDWGISPLRRIGLNQLSLQHSARVENFDGYTIESDNQYQTIYVDNDQMIVHLK